MVNAMPDDGSKTTALETLYEVYYMSTTKQQLETMMREVAKLANRVKLEEEQAKAEARRQEKAAKPISVKMGPTGGIVADNVGSGFASKLSLYPEQWDKLAEYIDSIREFAHANKEESDRLRAEQAAKKAS